MQSGFVSLVGRPNVGKSSIINTACGRKVSIVSDKPQTTRTRVRAVLHRSDAQIVFVDTPGIHKPVTELGKRVNATALEAVREVDVTGLVIDATMPFGRGDQFVADRIDIHNSFVVVNKIDATSRAKVMKQLLAVSSLDALAYFPVSARTGEGLPVLLDWIAGRLPAGEPLYPPEMVRETPDILWVADLVREELLGRMHDELPYSIATRVTEYEWPRIRCEIVVERDSQKGMVIGKGGQVLKEVGTAVRLQLAKGAHIELVVVVDDSWQQRPDRIAHLGY
ncbi:MAG: GTPase Era [Acidimicrobiaceae bacterium]|nr:GTPase Era [Ilumatobacteraceae bacterium]NQW67846.1 GTPase Era [Acidimicrobiaceae bacterium]